MKKAISLITFIVILLFSVETKAYDDINLYVEPENVKKALKVFDQSSSRLDRKGFDRAFTYRESISKYSHQYGIPEWILYGVLYNETNMKMIMGDNLNSYGMGQIRCSMTKSTRRGNKMFSWHVYLIERRAITVCADLILSYDQNIHSTAIILAYNRSLAIKFFKVTKFNPIPNKIWKYAIVSYNLGMSTFTKKKVDFSYYYRVLFFGKNIVKRFEKPYCSI